MKRFGPDLLNKDDTVMEKVVHKEEQMECITGDPFIYVRGKKDFEMF